MAPPAKGAEYKQVTVLFADVVGSMDIAAAVDAERLREIIAELVNRTAAVVERYGGTVHQFTGDGIMAMFGAPMALEDHAIRACLAGLGIQDHCQRLAQRVASSDGVDLRLRVGLNSGQVITGEIGSGPFGYTAIGAQVGLAQRMESVAPPGGVMLSESTARLVERAAVLGEPQMVTIKGASAPVPVRQLLGVAAHPGRIGRSETTLVGRQWEMDRLVGFLDRSIGGKGCVVCVTGPAGIGKSRLIDEVATIARTRGVEVFSTFGESHASDIPFHAVARLLRAVAGVSGLADDAARERVRAQVRDADPQDLLLLDDLLGIAGATLAQTGVDPDARRTRLIALINAMSLARVQPAVYVIEDAHWVDEVSESMLAEFLSVIPQTPSMVLISYRPEYCGALSQVPSGQAIAVSPLSNSETSALLSELVGTDPSVDRVVALIAGRAAGNPFFAQEIVRELAQRGAVEGERGRYVCRTGVVEIQVPATLQATITARIDRLQPAAKETLSAAAVIGSRFSPDLLRTALQIEPALEDLLVSELIDHVVFTERDQYTFRHPLIRAVAYESQLKSDRAQVHRRLAETIAARDAISVDKYAALIAEHLEAAGDWHAAYDWHMRAGAWSSVRDSAAARLSWERARQIADELPADDMDRLVMRILPRAALCCTAWRVDLDISDSDFEELRRLCAEAGDTASLAIGMTGLIGEHIVHGRESQASGLKSEQLALIESLHDPMPAPGLRHGVSLLVAGAQDAIALTNVAVAERLGRAAVIHGGGLAASELLARALLGQDRTAEAEDVLRSFNPHQMDELDLVRWGLARIANLHWSMGDAQSADEVLHLLRERVTRHPLTLFVDGVESAARAFENELTAAAELSERVLADPKAPHAAVAWAAFGGALALALMGRGDDVARVAERAHAVAIHVDGLLKYLTSFGEVRALILCGEFDVAARRSADVVRFTSADDTLARGMANVLLASVAFARGHFDDTVATMEPTVAALNVKSAASWSFPAQLLLAQSYCALGNTQLAAKTLAELRRRYGRHIAVFEPQLRIADAWFAAAAGNVGTAIDLSLDAARLAKESGQQAIAMLALHDAVRFGDQICIDRLIEVARATDGQLAPMIAAHAEAVRDHDAAQIILAARQSERIGALLSATDAFAQAAVAFDRQGDRRRTEEAASAANRLAAACGGVKTPALILAAAHRPAAKLDS